MCGIAGYISKKKHPVEVLEKMLKELYHRGPDSSGVFCDGDYTAGMRRLSINDLTTGDQPLFNEDRTVVLFYNGEIYNYHSLRKALEKQGHKFKTNSDGEVICHLYEEEKDKLFERLDGMFAAALWDVKEKKLILARDLPGEKPLYYSILPDGGLVFASEIKSLVKFPGLKLDLNYQAIWDIPTFLWIPEPETIYQEIKALLPGQLLIADNRGICIKNFKNRFEENLALNGMDEKEIIGEVRRIVEASVKSRLLSDVPVGSFLSGGLDSSIIATIASRQLGIIDTFTIGFEDITGPFHGPYITKADESTYAEEYARQLGSRHHTVRVTGKTFLDALDDFCKYGDQPQAISSGLGVMCISKAARDLGIKVLLTGDGADECFGGYTWHEFLKNDHGKSNQTDKLVSFQDFDLPVPQRLQAVNSYPPRLRAWSWHYYATEDEKKALFSPEISQKSESSLRWFDNYKNDAEWEPKDFITQDRHFYMVNEMLKKADRMTMANSVEGRAPLVAPAILNLSKKLSYDQMVRGNQLKWVLRQAFADILPAEIIDRKKHGFNVPIDSWLKHDWKHLVKETFSPDSELFKAGIIHSGSLNAAKKMLNEKDRLNGHTIFCYIMLNKWLRNHNLKNI